MMTVGEKIQFYRKNLGLSQEELGQRLHVSRQTVSLWEKDQTVPSIDNLALLKEIFHISFDKIFASDLIRAVETAKIVLPDYSYETSLNMGVVRMVKERLSISSTELFYGLVCKLLENLK